MRLIAAFPSASILWLALAAVAPPTSSAPTPIPGPSERCTGLLAADFSRALGATAHLTSSKLMPAGDGVPQLCQVQGYVAPNTSFELRLPAGGWNGKFFHAGCTGSCGFAGGSDWVKECDYPLMRGYACIISDMGHRSSASDGLWAYRNLEAKVDFGFRATHRATVAGKAITEAFYGRKPAYSYFMGCSTGGRQALIEAQRFPHDFDGIIAGAPVISEGGTSMSFVWNLQALAAQAGKPLFNDADLALLHRASTAAGDHADGRRDGIIEDPRLVKIEPEALMCKAGQAGDCLSAAQVRAARKVYEGPRDSKGRSLYPGGGFMPGSERYWTSFVAPAEGRARAWRSGTDTTRYIMSDWGPGWDFTNFNWDQDPMHLAEMDVIYSASHPDLRSFKAAGGKLLIYHGWADTAVAPLNSVDYYETLERTIGGRAATQSFARLFMVPGMKHCFAGDGPFAIDYISAMEAWVERATPPDRLAGYHLAGNHDGSSMIRRFPFDSASVAFSRPIFPYPRRAFFSRGSRADGQSSGAPGERVRHVHR